MKFISGNYKPDEPVDDSPRELGLVEKLISLRVASTELLSVL